MNEAGTCRKFVVPELQQAGRDDHPHAITDRRTFTYGRIVSIGANARREEQKRADYLGSRPDFLIAVGGNEVALRAVKGVRQAEDCVEVLRIRLAYSRPGCKIVESR